MIEEDKEFVIRLSEQIEALIISSFSIEDDIGMVLIDTMLLVWFGHHMLKYYGHESLPHMYSLFESFIDTSDDDADPPSWLTLPGVATEYHYESFSSLYASLEEFYEDLIDFNPPDGFIRSFEDDFEPKMKEFYSGYFKVYPESSIAKWFLY